MESLQEMLLRGSSPRLQTLPIRIQVTKPRIGKPIFRPFKLPEKALAQAQRCPPANPGGGGGGGL